MKQQGFGDAVRRLTGRLSNETGPGAEAPPQGLSRRGNLMKSKSSSLALGLAALLGGALLVGCKEEEQDRILLFEKGTYLGQDDDTMGTTTPEQLRDRARNQGAL